MAPLRHVGAAVLRSCRHSGRAAPLRPSLLSPPTAASSRSSADSMRLISSGRGDLPPLIRQYWDTSRTWVRNTTQKYKKVLEEFEELDEHMKTTVRMYAVSVTAIGGVIYLVNQGIDTKIDRKAGELLAKIAEEAAGNAEFQKRAVTDFQEHVSKTQSDVSQLRQKILDNQESELEHRQQIMSGVHFFKINGYVFVPLSEFNDLVNKVKELENRTSTTTGDKVSLEGDQKQDATGQVSLKAGVDHYSQVTVKSSNNQALEPSKMTNQVPGVTDIIAASPNAKLSITSDDSPDVDQKRSGRSPFQVNSPDEDDGDTDAEGSKVSHAEDDAASQKPEG